MPDTENTESTAPAIDQDASEGPAETVTGAAAAPAEAPATPVEPAEPPVPTSKGKKPTIRREGKATRVIPASAETVTDAVVTDTEVDALPASATLAAPYAFYDDDSKLHSWAAGQVISDPNELALLVERGAIFESA